MIFSGTEIIIIKWGLLLSRQMNNLWRGQKCTREPGRILVIYSPLHLWPLRKDGCPIRSILSCYSFFYHYTLFTWAFTSVSICTISLCNNQGLWPLTGRLLLSSMRSEVNFFPLRRAAWWLSLRTWVNQFQFKLS